MKTLAWIVAAIALVPAGTLAGCGGDDADGASGPRVVATTTQAADMTRVVAGSRGTVVALLPPNADPHEHELRPSDVKALSGANLVIRSGGDVDVWLQDATKSAGGDAPELVLIDHVRTIRGRGDEAGDVDPHWWHDPRNGIRAVAAIRDALIKADPAGRAQYTSNADRYSMQLRALDSAAADCLGSIPPAQRKLVTTHDALGYFADRYGFQVIGTVIPSLSTQGQASSRDTAALVETIRRAGVRAIFTESSVNPAVERAIADEAGATIGDPLWADTLGPAGSSGATYLGALASNDQAVAKALGGITCKLPAVG